MGQQVLKELKTQELFNEVKTGMRCVLVGDRTFFFKFPDAALSSNAQLYEREMLLRHQKHVPSTDTVMKALFRGREIDINDLKDQESQHKTYIEHFRKQGYDEESENVRFYKKKLREVRAQIDEYERIMKIQQGALNYCLDVKVRQNTYLFYLLNCTYIKKGGEFINYFNHVQFESETTRSGMIHQLFSPFVEFLCGFGEAELRSLARSHFVMNLYKISSNTGAVMFPGAASEYNVLQHSLLFWCNYYDSVFKNLGSPEQYIIDSDSLFDNWVQNKINEMKSEAENGRNSGGAGGKVNKHKFVFKSPQRASSA